MMKWQTLKAFVGFLIAFKSFGKLWKDICLLLFIKSSNLFETLPELHFELEAWSRNYNVLVGKFLDFLEMLFLSYAGFMLICLFIRFHFQPKTILSHHFKNQTRAVPFHHYPSQTFFVGSPSIHFTCWFNFLCSFPFNSLYLLTLDVDRNQMIRKLECSYGLLLMVFHSIPYYLFNLFYKVWSLLS